MLRHRYVWSSGYGDHVIEAEKGCLGNATRIALLTWNNYLSNSKAPSVVEGQALIDKSLKHKVGNFKIKALSHALIVRRLTVGTDP